MRNFFVTQAIVSYRKILNRQVDGAPKNPWRALLTQGGHARGRAKAKQTKVARQLKYNSPEMDIESLQRELAAQQEGDSRDYEEDDPYADYVDEWDDADRDER